MQKPFLDCSKRVDFDGKEAFDIVILRDCWSYEMDLELQKIRRVSINHMAEQIIA